MRLVVMVSLAIAIHVVVAVAGSEQDFEATAYSDHGVTASGHETRPGIAAADPRVLPLGTRVRVTGAGTYSGEYVVRDTGGDVAGRALDIFVPDRRAAKRFGRRRVRIEVISWGDGARAADGAIPSRGSRLPRIAPRLHAEDDSRATQ